LELKINVWMVKDWSQGRRQSVTAEAARLAITDNFFGNCKVV